MSLHKRRPKEATSRPAMSPIKKSHDKDFISYPRNKVIGIIDTPEDAQAALHDLRAAGFPASQIRVLTGQEGAHRIDVRGDQHGPLAHIVRSTQKLLGDYELADATRYEKEMLGGHFVIGVTAHHSDERDKVLQILRSHTGHYINFYSPWTIEELAA